MNKDKALKLALDYLTGNIAGHLKGLADQKAEAITALRQSIEQAEQAQPVAKPLCKVGGMPAPGRMCPKVIVGGKLCGFTGECEHKQVTTSPPPRQPWVGLTDEEIDKTHETQVWDARRSYARAIEAKLKEKNT